MAQQLSEFLARVGPEFDSKFVAEHIGSCKLDEIIEYILDRDDLASLTQAGMKPLHRNKLFKAIQDERQKRVQTSTPGRSPVGRLVCSLGLLGALAACVIVAWRRRRSQERRRLVDHNSELRSGEDHSAEVVEWGSLFAKQALKDVCIDLLKDFAKRQSLSGSLVALTSFFAFLVAGLAAGLVTSLLSKGLPGILPARRGSALVREDCMPGSPSFRGHGSRARSDAEANFCAFNDLSWTSNASTACPESDMLPYLALPETPAHPSLASLTWVPEATA